MRKTTGFFGIIFTGRRLTFCIAVFLAWIRCALPACAGDFFNFAEYRLNTSLKVPEDKGAKNEFSGATGLRLSFRNADFRGYGSFSEDTTLWEKPKVGAGVFLFGNTFPTTLKAGHNSYSKSVSKMKNPSPSAVINPLSKSFSFSTGTGASLASISSGNQPLSFSICSETGKKIFPVQLKTESFITVEKNCVTSFSAKYSPFRSIFIQSSFSGGRFLLEGYSKILKKNNADFEAGYFHSGLGEICIHTPLLKLNFHSGIQESPYDVNPVWFKIDGRTSTGIFLLNFSYFAIPTSKDSPKTAPLIGGSSSICRTVEQASVNPQFQFLFDDKNASSLRLGFSALESWKVTATDIPVQLHTAKMRVAAEYKSRFLDFRIDWTRANILLEGTPPVKSSVPEEYQSYEISASLAGTKANFSASGSYTNYPPLSENSPVKEVYTADIKAAFPGACLTAKSGINVKMKDGSRYAGEFTAGALYTFKSRSFRALMKAEFHVAF